MKRPESKRARMATPRKLAGTALVLFLIPHNGFMLLFSPRGERHAFRGERKRYRTSPPISRRSAPERVFSGIPSYNDVSS